MFNKTKLLALKIEKMEQNFKKQQQQLNVLKFEYREKAKIHTIDLTDEQYEKLVCDGILTVSLKSNEME